ncbi:MULTISPECIES: response regulator [Deinococcus]|jgi:Response regulators consisting of a CheY-like receiver domain and a winged-helix DNA-binding domain|uniref:Response regulator n=1 Tax=Deinococcus radiodurans (strain ATCC 13939 / DSM 20539 / JCM 16871 / CCUG 27074 / LMG 4051 / NBRC 15346 / NCIMB 9279 / VKM B-1422 / R1) TaxID=243230 RepID=Q9RXA7_DEIRA|nr:response regulator [Deinococcus radiodurans R1 = ATCC 13939 = DSM 20539]QEM72360.1 response regulator [Deinococcus radiodurans]QIP28594.1 response regulator [Deinococcus radiodurans]UDK99594.1 response regulator [Deinococcus radiodurans R1 = ATCC 13939 = DSM 20539]UID69412.1 two-component system response regulator [Deinococcus radiodurans R1 = ATCC 13939 = DSM 20539]
MSNMNAQQQLRHYGTPEQPGILPIQFLLVEDSEPDVLLTQEVFEEEGLAGQLHVVRDGVEALDFLLRKPPYEQVPRPDVILLDINMPRMNGLELLTKLKTDPHLMTIPVFMLTTSQAEEDVLRSYQAHAASYVVKPIEFTEFQRAVQAMSRFMRSMALPGGRHHQL